MEKDSKLPKRNPKEKTASTKVKKSVKLTKETQESAEENEVVVDNSEDGNPASDSDDNTKQQPKEKKEKYIEGQQESEDDSQKERELDQQAKQTQPPVVTLVLLRSPDSNRQGQLGLIIMSYGLVLIAVVLAAVLAAAVGSRILPEKNKPLLVKAALVVYCKFRECCTEKWTSPNITGLQNTLGNRLFGQHLVTDTVYKAVKGHWNNKSPQKALVLSFNGWTGCGKNFVSKIIAEHAFQKGMESNYVHFIIATHDFPHKSELETYKTLLKEWIVGNVTNCARSIFIFDEMDKMPEGLVDVLKPFLDHYPEVGGIDYRNTIFLFLSNTGARIINEKTLSNWQLDKNRSDITIKQMDHLINLGAFNSKGGFWHTDLIEEHLIDYFVAFLPLERVHVKQCAKVDLEEKGIPVTDQLLNQIADELLYFPEDTKVFSKSGCKKVSSKVDLIIG